MIHEEEKSRILDDNLLVKEDLDESADAIIINRAEPDNEVLNEEEMFKLLDEEDDIVSPSSETDQNRQISEAKPAVTQNIVNSPELPTSNPEITEITIPIVYVFAVIIVGVLAAVFFMNH
jgi:hypothetical protein